MVKDEENFFLAIYSQGMAIFSLILFFNTNTELIKFLLFYLIYICEIPAFNFLANYFGKRKEVIKKVSKWLILFISALLVVVLLVYFFLWSWQTTLLSLLVGIITVSVTERKRIKNFLKNK